MDNFGACSSKLLRSGFRRMSRNCLYIAGAVLVGLTVTTSPAVAQTASDWVSRATRWLLFLPSCAQAERAAFIARLEAKRDALNELRRLVQSAIDAADDPNPSMFDEQVTMDKLREAEDEVQNQLIQTSGLLNVSSNNAGDRKSTRLNSSHLG